MSEAVVGAIIVSIGSIIVQLLINVSNRAKEHEQQAVYRANLDNELKQIRTKLDEHNEYGKKFSEGLSKIDTILDMASKDFPDIWYEVEHHYFELGLKDVREIAEYVQSKF